MSCAPAPLTPAQVARLRGARPTGLRPARWITGAFDFWSILGNAAGLSHASLTTFTGTPKT